MAAVRDIRTAVLSFSHLDPLTKCCGCGCHTIYNMSHTILF